MGDSLATAWWLDDVGTDPLAWSSAHWVAHVADRHGLPVWGENGGNSDYANMQLVFAQLEAFGYDGLLWAFNNQLYEGGYASIANYAQLIAEHP